MQPLVNVALICGDDRNRLTEQCIRSLYDHTDMGLCNLTVIANAVPDDTLRRLIELSGIHGFCLTIHRISLGGGAVTNRLLEIARAIRGEFLYHSATDFYFRPGWLDALLSNWHVAEAMGVGLLGGYSHPYHLPHGMAVKGVGGYSVQSRMMVAGGSWFMKWSMWDQFGPLTEEHTGLYVGGEDTAYNFRLIKAGIGRATLVPEVVVHTGRTNSAGNPTPGHEFMRDQEGILIE